MIARSIIRKRLFNMKIKPKKAIKALVTQPNKLYVQSMH